MLGVNGKRGLNRVGTEDLQGSETSLYDILMEDTQRISKAK